MTHSVPHSMILACGNPLRGDDGVALHIACCLQQGYGDPETEIRCAQQWTPELAERISKTDLAIFIDASATLTPGEIQLIPLASSEDRTAVTTHSMDPATLLGLAHELYGSAPERAFLLTIGGESFEHGNQFSRAVRQAIPEALTRIKALLSGVTLPNPDAPPPRANC